MDEGLTIQQKEVNPIVPVGWFIDHTDLRTVSPYVATESDVWVVTDGVDIVAMALVEERELHRLGVARGMRRKGVAKALVSHLLDEYNYLEARCRQSLDANKFYEATGWSKVYELAGDPEDLFLWEKSKHDEE